MFTADFDYNLPLNLIAQKPLPERDQSRMIVLHRESDEIFHSRFEDLPRYLNKGDVLVLNNIKVIPARVWGKKEGKEVEFLFLKEFQESSWEVLCRQARKVKIGDVISFSEGLEGKVIKAESEGKRVIQFSSKDVLSRLKKIGFAPLPPYIKRTKKNADI